MQALFQSLFLVLNDMWLGVDLRTDIKKKKCLKGFGPRPLENFNHS